MKVPYIDLVAQHAPIRQALLDAVGRVLDHGMFVNGPEVAEFEQRFAALSNTRYAIGVSDGTAALVLTLRGLGIGPGDEVITPPNSFLASTSCIALVGATPVFADVGDDYNIDPIEVERAITRRTKAVIAVHLTGRPADLDALVPLCKSRKIALIEDCAQAVGAHHRDRAVGSFGAVGCFSLHPLKNLNAVGDGGIITTDSDALAEFLRKARNHGLKNRDESEFFSSNDRLDTIQAAMLLVKLKHLNNITETRRANAAYYRTRLSGLPGIRLPDEQPHQYSVYHTYVIRATNRDKLKHYLESHGVECKIHYPIPIHRQSAIGNISPSLPRTEQQSKEVLSLPIHELLATAELERVCELIKTFAESTA